MQTSSWESTFWLALAAFVMISAIPAQTQSVDSAVVFKSRVYQRVGISRPEWRQIRLPDQTPVSLSESEVEKRRASCNAALQAGPRFQKQFNVTAPDGSQAAAVSTSSSALLIRQARGAERSIPLPTQGQIGEHWNYVTSVSWSPNGKLILVGSEAGSSTAHFEDYWLLDVAQERWRYAGGGNEARWSPDSSAIVWTTPRDLAPLGRIHVWVSHLLVVDVRTLAKRSLTSGSTQESEPFWCSTN